MNPNYSNALAAMEHYIEVVGRLAMAIQSGQEALVRMDLTAFERLTAEQEQLCAELKGLQVSAERPSASQTTKNGENSVSDEHAEFCRQRAALSKCCVAMHERVRRLNRVNQFFLNRARQSLEVLLRLVTPADGTYSAPSRDFARRLANEE
jgi:FlgN protein